MIKKTIYVAEDGSQFDTETDCRKYEEENLKAEKLDSQIHCYNEYGFPVPYWISNYDTVVFIAIDSKEAASYFADVMLGSEFSDAFLPFVYPTAGKWIYDEENEIWIDYNVMNKYFDRAKVIFDEQKENEHDN
ncbi:MAG: hypothetical protein NC548_22880 [Lachnospiraceae bacterium]|nr:hypothetical protein [Lachnospiraceae bacterium]